MRYTASPTRPAIAAIAAVLALQTVSASAQTTDPAATPVDPAPAPTIVAPPVLAPAPGVPAPSAATPQVIYKSDAPVVQAVPTIPAATATIAPPTSPATPKNAAKSVSQPPKTTASKTVVANEPAPVATEPVAQAMDTAPTDPVAATNMPVDNVITQPPEASPAVAATETDDGTEAGYWILGLGAALLVGAGSYAALRRKSAVTSDVAQPETMYGYKPIAEIDREAEPFVAVNNPADRFKTVEPVLVTSPEEAVATSAVEPMAPVQTSAITPLVAGDLATRREAMIAGTPSSANPFLTRKNRLRRANFILAQSGVDTAGEQVAAPSVVPSVAPAKTQDPVQVSYAFGKGSLRPPVLKPRYN